MEKGEEYRHILIFKAGCFVQTQAFHIIFIDRGG